MGVTIEEQLKDVILDRYKSVRAFTAAINVPYSTVDSALKREHGIKNAGVGNMLKIFEALDLDIESIPTGTLQKREHGDEEKLPALQEEAGQMAAAETPGDDDINRRFDELWDSLADSPTAQAALAGLLDAIAQRLAMKRDSAPL